MDNEYKALYPVEEDEFAAAAAFLSEEVPLDLSLKNVQTFKKKDNETVEEAEEFAAAMFLPEEVPLDLSFQKVQSSSKEANEMLEEFRMGSEGCQKLIKTLMPVISYWKRKIQTNDFGCSSINLNVNRKRKRSLNHDEDNDSAFSEEFIEIKPDIQIFENMYPLVVDEHHVQIGANGTIIQKQDYDKVDRTSAAQATRQLVSLVFDKETLATHSLTGKPSAAFCGRERPSKRRLDERKVADITQCVINNFLNATQRLVHGTITTKCATESKMWKKYARS